MTKDGLKYICKICDDLQQKKYYQEHSSKQILSVRNWQAKNRDKVRSYQKTPINRIRRNIRKRLSRVIKRLLGHSLHPSTKEIGCSVQELKQWIESKFSSNMSWENYGSLWSIDHIRPIASFDINNETERKIINHWTNLQPLLNKDNLSKGSHLL
jgi:hypothetical protein